MASCKLRSISFRTSLLPPRSTIVQAFGSLHSSKKQNQSSPNFRISNRPQSVPISDSWISSVRETMVAPTALATRLLSVFRNRLKAVILAFCKKCCAKSLTPFSVMTTSGLCSIICMHMFSTYSSSNLSMAFQSCSSVISIVVCDSPFLYSKGESNKRMRGFSMRRRILEWVVSFWNMTPFMTQASSNSPPGIFSTLAYRLISTDGMPPRVVCVTVVTA
mmetsp:Transcript_12408/g.29541  ORF Transcript_12408/g.29541 Transcript_12408/m.29541 type:complete len:219 (-) Transcript_12408:659-1315(-)